MRYYPVLLDCRNRRCCVVGGGTVAERKVKALLSAGAAVTVISPRVTRRLAERVSSRKVTHIARPFAQSMLKGFFIAIAATDDVRVNHAVSAAAARAGMLVNVVDDPQASTFIVPSVIDKSGLIISISTSGRAPCLSRRIRLELEKEFVPKYASRLRAISGVRARLKTKMADAGERKRCLTRLARTQGGACRE